MAAKASSEQKAPTLGELDEQKGGKKGAEGETSESDKGKKGKDSVKVKQPGGKGRAILVTCLFWLFLLGTGLILVMFDPTPTSVIRGSVLLFLDPEGEAFPIYYQSELLDMLDQQKEIDQERINNEKRTLELDEEESRLEEWAGILEEKEIKADEIIALYESGEGGNGLDNMQRIVFNAGVLKKMPVDSAAKNLQAMYEADAEGTVKVALEIGSSKLGPILAKMDVETSAEIFLAIQAEEENELGDYLDSLEDE